MVLGLIGLLAGAWAWDLFDLRSRWAPMSPPAVLSWNMPERIDDFAFGGALPVKEREAGKTLLVVEVQLPRRLLDGGSGWNEWSAEFRGPNLTLVTSDGRVFPPSPKRSPLLTPAPYSLTVRKKTSLSVPLSTACWKRWHI